MQSLQSQIAVVLLFLVFIQINRHQIIAWRCGQRLPDNNALMMNAPEASHWPWHAAIFYKQNPSNLRYICGGTLINSNSILTAGHCVSINNELIEAKHFSVSLGRLNLGVDESSAQSFDVAKIILNPNFNSISLNDDIAIMRLSNNVIIGNLVRPVCLWNANRTKLSDVIGKDGIVIGWGTTENGTTSNVLREASLPVIDSIDCLATDRDFYGAYLSNTNFCAGFRNGTSACDGDSGGSMTFEEEGLHYIRGIVSQSSTIQNKTTQELTCNSMQYVIFTDVAQYLPWIDTIINECVKNVRCNYYGFKDGVVCDIFLIINHSDRKCKIFFIEFKNTSVDRLVINGQMGAIPDLFDAIIKFELSSLYLNHTNLKTIDKASLVAFKEIKNLHIENNDIAQVAADTFDDLQDLGTLFLSDNKLDSLPEGLFKNNKDLQILWLFGNKIKILHRDIFQQLHNLVELYLDGNQLENLPDGLFRDNENLDRIFLYDNKIKVLQPDIFQNLHNVKKIHLYNNSLETLPSDLFRNNKKLEIIWLQENRINVLHPDLFKELQNLKVFYFHLNWLETLPDGLFRNNRNLETLWLNQNRISNLHHLDLLYELRNLTTLSIGNNQMESLPDDFFQYNQKLDSIGLHASKIKVLHPDLFEGLHNLRVLYLNDNQLEILPDGLFRNNRNLKTLWLNNNKISTVYPDLFKGLPNLRVLYLHDNQLEILRDGLFANNPKLEKIWLQRNKIKTIECDFYNMVNLVNLDLRGNTCVDKDCDFKTFCGTTSLSEMHRMIWNKCPV